MLGLSTYEMLGVLSGLFSVVALPLYVWSIIKGRTHPNQAAWWSWWFIILVYTISAWVTGISWQMLIMPVWHCFDQLLIAILSLKYGDKRWDPLNLWCVAGAGLSGLSLPAWFLSGEPHMAFVSSIIGDGLGAIPNFRHARADPGGEDKLAWGLYWISAVLMLLAIEHWNLVDASYAVCLLAIVTGVICLLFLANIKRWLGMGGIRFKQSLH